MERTVTRATPGGRVDGADEVGGTMARTGAEDDTRCADRAGGQA